jgi:branched-subunit amino acid ABC-type transport system permease component
VGVAPLWYYCVTSLFVLVVVGVVASVVVGVVASVVVGVVASVVVAVVDVSSAAKTDDCMIKPTAAMSVTNIFFMIYFLILDAYERVLKPSISI